MVYREKDVNKLESVQRRATMPFPELRFFSYERYLLQYVLTTLETRILRGDLIEVP